jgi:hypothetical protein
MNDRDLNSVWSGPPENVINSIYFRLFKAEVPKVWVAPPWGGGAQEILKGVAKLFYSIKINKNTSRI